MMKRQLILILCLSVLAASAFAQSATTVPVSANPIPHDQLLTMYARELEDKFDPTKADQLIKAHELVENYFAATTADARKKIVTELEATGVDANIIGRIIRIRLNWPALPGGIYYVNERMGKHDVFYFIGLPKNYDRSVAWPLVIMLPTAHAFVVEPPPDAAQVARIYTDWINAELVRHPDSIVIMPLLNLDELWGPSYAGMNSVIQSMHHAANRVNIDPRRVYLFGHGMSGHAVWNLGLHYPTYFAALGALAGGASQDWQRLRVVNLKNVLPVAWHDRDDKSVPVRASRGLVEALRLQKIDVDYEETQELGHVPPQPIAERVYTKMRARDRDLYPKEVWLQSNRPDTLFNRNDWVQVYDQIRTGDDQRLNFRTGFFVVHKNSYKIEAKLIEGNQIDVTCDNVGSMRLYLNDQMIDFSRPVRVVVNKKGRVEGYLKPSIDEMLKDQVFLGRGWRYYTSVVDIDLVEPTTRPTTRPTTQPASRRAGE
jgi:hypothetical protein